MAQKTPPPLTTGEIMTHVQQRANPNSFSQPLPSEELSPEEIAAGLAKYKASVEKLSQPFSNYKHTLDRGQSQSQEWICPDRIPLDGLVLLSGAHGTGKTLFMHQLAAAVSSGGNLLGSPSAIQSNVLIVSPTTSVQTYQRPHLAALGADLSRIRNISCIQDPTPDFYTSGFRSLSLPNNFSFLLETMDKFHPRLVILDDFMSLLLSDQRMTNERLGRLLTDLRLRMIERHAVCILVRNGSGRFSHTRPCLLERSDSFDTIATSSLLLAPDPFQDPDPSQPKRLLLSHVDSNSSALAPTLPLQIQPLPNALTFAQLTIRDSHPLDQDSHLPSASDLLSYRHDVLQRHILVRRLLSFINKATDPIPVPTLYDNAPHSSLFQVQRALKDLLNMGLIERPSRGFYAPLNLTQPLNGESLNALNGTAHLPLTNNLNVKPLKTVETPLTNEIDPIEEARRLPKKEPNEIPSIPFHAQPLNELTECATTPVEEVKLKLTEVAATTPTEKVLPDLTQVATTTPVEEVPPNLTTVTVPTPVKEVPPDLTEDPTTTPVEEVPPNLTECAATTPVEEVTPNLTEVATTTLIAEVVPKLTQAAATTPIEEVTPNLTEVATTTPMEEVKPKLTEVAATRPTEEAKPKLMECAATTPMEEVPPKLTEDAATPNESSASGLQDIAEALLDPAFVARFREIARTLYNSPIAQEIHSIATMFNGPYLTDDIMQLQQFSPPASNHSLLNRPQDMVEILLFKTYGNELIAVKTTAHRTGSPVCGPSQARYRFV